MDIGLALHAGQGVDVAIKTSIELVASSVQRLRLPAAPHAGRLTTCSRVLVFGRDSDQRAHYLAERGFFSRMVGSPLYEEAAEGVFWVEELGDVEELEAESFDAVLLLNLVPRSVVDCEQILDAVHRVVRPGGVVAGTAALLGAAAAAGLSAGPAPRPLRTEVTSTLFRRCAQQLSLEVALALDMALEGHVVLSLKNEQLGAASDEELAAASQGLQFVRFLLLKPLPVVAAAPAAAAAAADAAMSSPPRVKIVRSNDALRLSGRESTVLAASAVTAASEGVARSRGGMANAIAAAAAAAAARTEPIVISGVSLGLPNALRPDCRVFDERNLERVFSGENCISQLTEAEQQRILDQNVTQVLKIDGKRVDKRLTKPSEVIKLASKLGRFDLAAEYGVPAHVVATLDTTYALAIAAGLEALKSAGIELRREGEKDMTLPADMQDDTGVVFASSFPCLDSCVQEVSRSARGHAEALLAEFRRAKEGAEAASAAAPRGSAADSTYEFDRKLLFKLLVMANSQLAELICARGPNTHVNAACASTSQAIAIAEDWIRPGRCKRVVVVSADNATSENLLPFIGTGFLALTAASIAPTVETGALPFDKRRNGMILGMGAAGLVVEAESAALARGVRPRAELLGSHFLNSAFHASVLDRKHIAQELARFVTRMEQEHGLDRTQVAPALLYFSHETFTCAQGGCAKAEMDALSEAFGERGKQQITVVNTKGITGHPMGVGLEDVVAVASLEQGKVPPMANFRVADESLGVVNLARPGGHDCEYVLRFAAGFGSQFVFLLLRKWAPRPAGGRGLALDCATVAGTLPLSTSGDKMDSVPVPPGGEGEGVWGERDDDDPARLKQHLASPALRGARIHAQHSHPHHLGALDAAAAHGEPMDPDDLAAPALSHDGASSLHASADVGDACAIM
jgi:SAM-dependent methyltransferase